MNLSTRFLHIFDSYGFCFSFMALVEQIPLTKACSSQRNQEALYSPFVPLQYQYADAYSKRGKVTNCVRSSVKGEKTYCRIYMRQHSAMKCCAIDVEAAK